VAVELARRQAEVAILVWQVAARMVGDQHDAAAAVALDHHDRGEKCRSCHEHSIWIVAI
jgi:hypothetical protein